MNTTYLPENALAWLNEKTKQTRVATEPKVIPKYPHYYALLDSNMTQERAKGERKAPTKRKASGKENNLSK